MVTGHTNALAGYKKAKGEVSGLAAQEVRRRNRADCAEHLKMAKEIDAKLTK